MFVGGMILIIIQAPGRLLDKVNQTGHQGLENFFAFSGVFFAAVTGFFCIQYLLRYLQKNSTRVFVYYRWGLAVLIVVVALLRG